MLHSAFTTGAAAAVAAAAMVAGAASLVLAQAPAGAPAAGAQAPAAPVANAAPAGDVIGVGTFIHSVADANRSIAFYSEMFGLMPPAMPRAFGPNEVVANLY